MLLPSPFHQADCEDPGPRHILRYFSPTVSEIGLVEVSGSVETPPGVRAGFGRRSRITLRFLLSATGQRSLDALRDARRSLLREEWTRGREPDEPSLGDAVFSVREIRWEVRPEQRQLCLQKLEELRVRANRMLMEIEPG